MINQRSLLLVCLIGIVLSAGCTKQKLFSYFDFSETLLDGTTNQPKAGVTIHVQICSGGNGDQQMECANWKKDIGASTTDSHGHFSIHAREARSDQYWIYIDGSFKNSSASSNGFSLHPNSILYY